MDGAAKILLGVALGFILARPGILRGLADVFLRGISVIDTRPTVSLHEGTHEQVPRRELDLDPHRSPGRARPARLLRHVLRNGRLRLRSLRNTQLHPGALADDGSVLGAPRG